MEIGKFRDAGVIGRNPKWESSIKREKGLYRRDNEIRSEFLRDYNRILHSTAYRRLKHKTQVFFATRQDHICTRMEHVNHVASVSYTLSQHLGLNTELTSAIATGHDLGHAPFGHQGERKLKSIITAKINKAFWHEENSLRFVDKIETLPDPGGLCNNLNLTYAVRDGIISHCGEVNEAAIFPRDEPIDLHTIVEPNQYPPFTWEGCIVKIADKIAYLGRDIEDAVTLGILNLSQLKELKIILKETIGVNLGIREINNTVLMHDFMIDLCETSSPELGIRLSIKHLRLINKIKEFNYENIYNHKRLNIFKNYSDLIITSISDCLFGFYDGKGTIEQAMKYDRIYPMLISTFKEWLIKYSDIDLDTRKRNKFGNEIIYGIDNPDDYVCAVIDYISGMTDSFAIRVFGELTTF